jgi:hypothetical protein
VIEKFDEEDEDEPELHAKFMQEIGILHQIYHQHVVRVWTRRSYEEEEEGEEA